MNDHAVNAWRIPHVWSKLSTFRVSHHSLGNFDYLWKVSDWRTKLFLDITQQKSCVVCCEPSKLSRHVGEQNVQVEPVPWIGYFPRVPSHWLDCTQQEKYPQYCLVPYSTKARKCVLQLPSQITTTVNIKQKARKCKISIFSIFINWLSVHILAVPMVKECVSIKRAIKTFLQLWEKNSRQKPF